MTESKWHETLRAFFDDRRMPDGQSADGALADAIIAGGMRRNDAVNMMRALLLIAYKKEPAE